MSKTFVSIHVFDHKLGKFASTLDEQFDSEEAAKEYFDGLKPTADEFEPYDVWDGAKHRVRFSWGTVESQGTDDEWGCVVDLKEFAVERTLKVEEVK